VARQLTIRLLRFCVGCRLVFSRHNAEADAEAIPGVDGGYGEGQIDQLAGLLDVTEPDSGMRALGWIRTGEKDSGLAGRARALGLEVTALSNFTLRHGHPGALILGFAGCPAAELERGVEVLASALPSPEIKVNTAGSVGLELEE